MIALDRHLEVLLLDNDCVIVPGLGGFMAHPVPARLDESDGCWLPPMRTLGFNPALRSGGSLLAGSYSAAADISYPDAVRQIEAEVEELHSTLAEQGTYLLGNVGTLALGPEGGIVFEPNEAGVLTPALYGLGAVKLPTLNAVAPQIAKKPEESVAEPPAKAGAQPGSMPAWVYTAISAAAAVLLFFLVSTPVSNSVEDIQLSSMMPRATINKAPKQIKAAAKPATTAAKPAPAATKPVAATAKPAEAYCIVLASHVTQAGAERYVEQLKGEGYAEAEVLRKGSTVRVVYGNYKNEAEAQSALRQLRGNQVFGQGWIYKR